MGVPVRRHHAGADYPHALAMPDGGIGSITRYDLLFLSALAIQLAMLVVKLEA